MQSNYQKNNFIWRILTTCFSHSDENFVGHSPVNSLTDEQRVCSTEDDICIKRNACNYASYTRMNLKYLHRFIRHRLVLLCHSGRTFVLCHQKLRRRSIRKISQKIVLGKLHRGVLEFNRPNGRVITSVIELIRYGWLRRRSIELAHMDWNWDEKHLTELLADEPFEACCRWIL